MMINVEIFEDRDSGMGVSTRELGRVEVFFLPSYSSSFFFFFFQAGSCSMLVELH